MPKLLVLFAGIDEGVASVAESIHQGARRVRFAEADLMRLPGEATSPRVARIRTLDGAHALAACDAIALGGSDADVPALVALLEATAALGTRGTLANKLAAVFPAADAPMATGAANPLWPLLEPMARYGMILVPPGYAGPDGMPEDIDAASRRLGTRLADIAAWITHARSHHAH